MGGVGSLPHRVNFVYGGRFALVKKRRGDCIVDTLDIDEAVLWQNWRSHCDHKWFIRVENHDIDGLGRPITCIIRNDRHPQRSLRAGQAVCVDSKRWSAQHRWILEYVDTPGTSNAVMSPFYLYNLSDKKYLSIDERSGRAMMQPERPAFLWEFQNAAELRAVSSELPTPSRQNARINIVEELTLEQFAGAIFDAFSGHPFTCDGTRMYTSPDDFVATGSPLGAEEVLEFPHGLADVFQALFGPASSFRQILADGEDPVIFPMKPLSRFPWCYVGATNQKIKIPVKGLQPFEEELRVSLCRDGLGPPVVNGTFASVETFAFFSPALAVQFSSVLRVWPLGDFVTETFHVFYKHGRLGSLRLRSFGKAPPGRAHSQALDGMQDARKRFLSAVIRVLNDAPSRSWTSQGTCPSIRNGAADDIPSRPSSMDAASFILPENSAVNSGWLFTRLGAAGRSCFGGSCLFGLLTKRHMGDCRHA